MPKIKELFSKKIEYNGHYVNTYKVIRHVSISGPIKRAKTLLRDEFVRPHCCCEHSPCGHWNQNYITIRRIKRREYEVITAGYQDI